MPTTTFAGGERMLASLPATLLDSTVIPPLAQPTAPMEDQ
jgi:hypothetical protein